MTTTVLEIYNAAISAVRGKSRLTSLSNNTRERTECDIWYDQVRTQVLEAAYWPGARATARLTLLKTRDQSVAWANGDPEAQFRFAYGLPTNYLRAWHLPNYEQFTISFDITQSQLFLNTNVENAALIYAYDQVNPAFWTPGLRSAIIYGLAGSITGAIGGNTSLMQLNFTLANDILTQAQSTVSGQLFDQKETLPPALAARGYPIEQETRFYHPYGELFAGALVNA